MTGREWLACDDPEPMLGFLRGASARKLRLFACACCRRVWHLLDERSRPAVEAAERFAEGLADEAELGQAQDGLDCDARTPARAAFLASVRRYDRPSILLRYGIVDWNLDEQAQSRLDRICLSGSRFPVDAALAVTRSVATADATDERAALADLLRDFRGPFGDLPEVAAAVIGWQDGLVMRLAEASYDERLLPSGELDLVHLAVLADALEEAGCDNADLLGHLRGTGPHVRGCWAVDLLLGKE